MDRISGLRGISPPRKVSMFLLCLVFSLVVGIIYSDQARAESFMVTSNADDGGGDALTLREAVNQANANSVADTITFDLEAGNRTITLTQGQLTASASQTTTIDGEDDGITISGNDQSRIFQVNNSANLTLRSITLTDGNSSSSGGGAILNNGTLTVIDSTISDNSASGSGGGIHSITEDYSPNTTPPDERTTITNSTISGNSSGTRGSGVFNSNGYTEINYSTITNNTSTFATSEGMESFGDNLTGTRLTASIVAGNTSNGQPRDVGNSDNDTRAYESGGYNVIGAVDAVRAGEFSAQGDTTGRTVTEAFGTANPALADNGGSTQTIALRPGSVAIDRAASGPALDQRGESRPFDIPSVTNGAGSNGTDSGSFERNTRQPDGTLVVNSSADATDQTGCTLENCTLREAVNQANGNAVADTITFDLGADDRTITLTQGQLTASATQTTTIDGEDDGITISGNDQSRIFQVNNSANLTLRSITLTDGNSSSSGGGAILNNGTLTLTDSTISGNSASSIGGGINNNSTVTITDSTISNNSASNFGGGINNFGTVTLTDSTISNNSASTFGGGINSSSGTLTVTGSTISNNTVSNRGGGIFSNTDSYSPDDTTPPEDRTTITNSTISGNSAGSFGSGVFNNNGYTEINYSTIANNTSTNAAVEGVESDGDSATGTRLTASIVAGNTSSGQPKDVGNGSSDNRPYESGGNNVIGQTDRASDFSAQGDTTNRTVAQAFGTADPTLADNGGSTQTIALEPGSVAINRIPANTEGVPEADQRGVERPQNSASDSGSFEFDGETDILVISPDELEDATEGEAYSQQLSASGGSSGPYTFEVTEGDLPDGLTLSDDGLISGTPTEEATTRTFTVQAEDGSGFTGSREYTITVIEVNDAPVAQDDSYQTDEDETLSVNAEEGVLSNDTDTDNDNEDLTASLADDVQNGQLTLEADGSFTYTPDEGFNGEDTFTYSASDGEDESNEATVTIEVGAVNDAPTISEVEDQAIRENTSTGSIRFTVEDIDDPANELTVTGSSSNTDLVRQGGIEISGSGERRTVRVTPVRNQTGSTRITLTVEDPDGLTNTQTFTVKVTQTPPPSNECTITGTQRDDVLRGTPGRDVICGLGGDDTLIGGGGDDILRGGPGDDALKGGPGDDTLIGGPGRDALDGGGGTNSLRQ